MKRFSLNIHAHIPHTIKSPQLIKTPHTSIRNIMEDITKGKVNTTCSSCGH